MKPATRFGCAPRWYALAFLSLGLAMQPATADPVAINNPSFESATYVGANSWTDNLEDTDPDTDIEWMGRDGNLDSDAFIERIGGFFAHGQAHIGMEADYYIYQDTGVAWQPNSRYTLTVAIGNRNTGFTIASNDSVAGLTNAIPFAATAAEAISSDELLMSANVSENASTWPVSTFREFTLVFDTGSVPPSDTIVIFAGSAGGGRAHFDNFRLDVVGLADPDGDGLPSAWETAHGLNPNSAAGNDGAAGDPDADGSSNLQEFQRGTDPRNPDTDGDGALDGHETLTGIYVSPTDIGTDPLNPDTDGDTLPDGAEVTAAQPTDPNKADTDGDGFEDQAELAAGTNPSVGGQDSFPTATGDLLVGLNFVGGRVDGTVGASPSGPAGVVAQTNWNNLPDLAGSGVSLINAANEPVILRANWTVNDTYTLEAGTVPADPDSELMYGFLLTRQEVLTQVVVRNIAYPSYDVYVYADGGSTRTVGTYTVNGASFTGVQDTSNWPVDTGGGTYQQIVGSGGEGNFMIFRNVTGSTMTLTAVDTTPATLEGGFGAPINAIQIVRATGDADGDGMPDLWEDSYGFNKNNPADASLDADSDGSSNLSEYQRGTDPRNPDTDGDGLSDGVETKTGIFVSATDTGTDPLNADTDGDGLLDGVETGTGVFVNESNTGSNPNLVDTDGDTYPDGEEVVFGSDPVSAASTPSLPTPLGYWSFDDRGEVTTADLSGAGNDGIIVGFVEYVEGASGAQDDYAASFDGVDAAIVTDFPLLEGLEAFTMSGWVNFSEPQANRTGFFGQNDSVEFGMIDLDTMQLWTPTGGAVEADFGPSSNGWRHLAVVADATGRRLYIDGVQAASGPVGTPTTVSGFMFNIGGGGIYDGSGNFFNGLIDDVAVWDVALPAAYVKRLADRILTPGGGSAGPPFEITSITFNSANQTATVGFPTIPGMRYRVFRRDNTTNDQWLEADDFIATGETGVHNSVIPANVTTRLFRVTREAN